MDEIRLRPKNDFLKSATWQEIYHLTEHWQKDMAFYNDELRFFHKLVDKYFMWMMKDTHIRLLQEVVRHIEKLDLEHNRLEQSIQKHLTHIESLLSNNFSYDAQKFRSEHENLESEIDGFIRSFRDTKKEVFALTEKVMHEEKLKHLLSS